ncbi:hypothetical protein NY593_15040, partial [Enterobacter asburiae]|uniref:hypothetical protein n=2 Tax=Gammaproteobacteria TaxID=1236 RepID=UPI0022F020C2
SAGTDPLTYNNFRNPTHPAYRNDGFFGGSGVDPPQLLYSLWVSDNEVQTRWRKYSFGLSFNYLRIKR